MNTNRSCGCKSFRSCYVCESQFDIPRKDTAKELVNQYPNVYFFCPQTNLLHLKGSDISLPFPGIKIIQDFISAPEESQLVRNLDSIPWDLSQSGRRKQNFGPKTNFKKRKVKCGNFKGFPCFTKFVQDRFQDIPGLQTYKTVEQCSIEYKPETGSCIDPHIDDCWVWGERIVQLNLLSASQLTLIPYKGGAHRYNLSDLKNFPRIMTDEGEIALNPFSNGSSHSAYPCYTPKEPLIDGIVKIPLPRRSLLVMYGEPRYDWEHCILREDITERRIVIAYREFTPRYLPGGEQEQIGQEILEKAKQFWT